MPDPTICILDYGSGNVKSVYNMISSLTPYVEISNSPESIQKASHLILPGVGAFKAAMQKITKTIPLEVLSQEVFLRKKPFLGICVGMQVLADTGEEFEITKGLGWIPGKVVKIKVSDLPLPHVGWNNVDLVHTTPLLEGFTTNQDFYFVHSFVIQLLEPQTIVATTTYGEVFTSILQKENVYGVQFHPEKSQIAGKKLLCNFLKISHI